MATYCRNTRVSGKKSRTFFSIAASMLAACSFPNGTSPFDRFESGGGLYVTGDAIVPTHVTPGVQGSVTIDAVLSASSVRNLDFVVIADASAAMGLEQNCQLPDGTMDIYCLEQPAIWNAGPDYFDPATLGAQAVSTQVLSAALITTRPFGTAATYPAGSWLCLMPPSILPHLVESKFAFTDRPADSSRITETTDQCAAQNGLSLYGAVTDSSELIQSGWDGVAIGDGVAGFGPADMMGVQAFLAGIVAGNSQALVAGSMTHNASATEAVGSATELGEWRTSLWLQQPDSLGIFQAMQKGHSVVHSPGINYRAHVYDRDGRWLGTVGDHIDTSNTDPIVRIVVESAQATALHVLWIRPNGGTLESALVSREEQSRTEAKSVCDDSCRIDVAFEVDLDPPVAMVGIVSDSKFWNSDPRSGVQTQQEVAIANAIWFD